MRKTLNALSILLIASAALLFAQQGNQTIPAGSGGGVASFNARTGAVLPTSGDYTCSQVTNCISSAAYAALTDGSTVTWAIGSKFLDNRTLLFTVHGGSRTLNITGLVSGGSYVLKLTQDGTGGEGLTLGTGCTWLVSGGGSGAITPSTGPGAIDVLAFTYDGANCLANFNTNFN